MRILMLAWRDIKHPKMGGAEVVTDIYLKGLSKKHDVVLFSSAFKGCKKKEKINGYSVVRRGNRFSVYFWGLLFALRNRFDVIIDQVNTIPFFTPLFFKDSIAFFHQLCLDVWFWESKLSVLGYMLENVYLKLYRNHKAFVVSESTKKDLVKYAWMNPKNILVLENQIDFKPVKRVKKKEKAFCFCGRLKKSKRVQDCIRAIKDVDASLYIIGDGDYRRKLENLVKKLGLRNKVVFFGRVSFEKRNEIMSRCLAILVPSVREGWGLIVTEANANGTMAITYNVPGLVDSNKTGIIVSGVKEMAKAMKWVLKNPKKVIAMSEKSLEHAGKYCNWDKNVRRLEEWLTQQVRFKDSKIKV